MVAPLLTVNQFCEKHSISRSTFYRHPPKVVKIGKSTRITSEQEADWIASLPTIQIEEQENA